MGFHLILDMTQFHQNACIKIKDVFLEAAQCIQDVYAYVCMYMVFA